MKPRLLDLFCGAGGCSVGYHRAGFDVIGVDHNSQPNYPFAFAQSDAIEFIGTLLDDEPVRVNGEQMWFEQFDAIHASPPCQAHSTLRTMWNAGHHTDLIELTRSELKQSGKPYVIENVVGAPLVNPVMLCGSSFGLGAAGRQLRRHRLFECNFPIMVPPCQHNGPVIGVYGTGGGGQMNRGFKARGRMEAGTALGTDWMTLAESAQAIPPAYCEHIGGYLLSEVNRRERQAA